MVQKNIWRWEGSGHVTGAGAFPSVYHELHESMMARLTKDSTLHLKVRCPGRDRGRRRCEECVRMRGKREGGGVESWG